MPIEVILPKVDMDMETGTIEAWHVKEGDLVRQGDTIFEIGTNKAVMEVEAPATGAIRNIKAETGVPISVGTPVAWIYLDGEAATTPSKPAAATASVAAATPVSKTEAPAAPVTAVAPASSGLRATPLARRIARQNGLDLKIVAGTGPRGRIGEADVKRHLEQRPRCAPAQETRPAPAPSANASEGRLQPFSAIRRIVANRLSESMRTAPHFYLTSEIEMSAARDLLGRLAKRHERIGAPKPSLTVLIARVAAHILRDHPVINASAEGEATRFHERIDIGIAMERDGDLVVPVLRNAGAMDMPAMTREFARLRDGMAKRTLTPAELGGGTFTISNLGMYGVDSFTAIINPPQGAILAVGRTVDKPVGRDGEIVLRPMANFTLSSDHRIVDGVAAARFMADLREALENPELLL
ncbi:MULTISPECIES: dihydrolipoamide acetyltransferase family protein [Bosea]|uniref:dihydrolipoamide acetyltransferase family protein n=1 Tax=Bosea TaxID=85413 RepID=UPI00214FF46E|nr:MULTISPECIES: dihydrolipoamide acetyltransferase family protein [Bosea]MCR4522388.1 2-oxo acid dehydrogenase subunit E2 [Bosea sp. 47.2.35]MDR6829143.1 pyruvate dehydrogenase E2 component (dihydrolipoamide acetyltransferase) [Bosea robiniae]MDR6896027.1 pyruvate dehydrogenase E2 component (dihydrolipoamide acetyltransferase) [Bosea sp. BE109]MDR7139424.1 pyruvate dehydrogenase E2 component (dihydrolipoamide acetyltransferase) [Bosea sp. BE168]MDR7176122.1 pyruvate dehydrogenase E2 component